MAPTRPLRQRIAVPDARSGGSARAPPAAATTAAQRKPADLDRHQRGQHPGSAVRHPGGHRPLRRGDQRAAGPMAGSHGHFHCHGRRRHGHGRHHDHQRPGRSRPSGSWTLGPAPGVNTLKATAGSISVNIDATAVTGPPSAHLHRSREQPDLGAEQPACRWRLRWWSRTASSRFPGRTWSSPSASGGGSVSGPVQTTSTQTALPRWADGAWAPATTNTADRHRPELGDHAGHLHRHCRSRWSSPP